MRSKDNKYRLSSLIGITVCAGLLMVSLSGCNLFNKNPEDPDNQPITPNTSTSETGGTESQPSDTTTPDTTTTTAAPTSPGTVEGKGYCNSDDGLRIRSGPGTDYQGIGGLKYGEEVSILGREGDWYKIVFKETGGYVSAQFIQATPPAALPGSTTTTAPQA
ncbi:MAG: SH3 domain-containing protein [Clostridiales bacterium]|nr:SH3 domain-containing protein [Clostridiales bacterium]